jgi:GNAT superfamily N-acetyltransferase
VSELIIRRYRQEDQSAVWELHVLGLQQMGAYGGDGPWDDDMRHIEEHYYQHEGEFLIGEYEGKVAAMGAFRKTGEHEAEIKRMRTHPDFQGKGFAQRIYELLETKARALGYLRLHLDTGVNLILAQKLYLKNGFVEIKRDYVHMGIHAIFYEKKLG